MTGLFHGSKQVQHQQVRFKKFGRWIVPHGKPRWIPMARSKMFKNPPESTRPVSELDHIQELKEQYKIRMAALVHYLHEDDVKNSDTGEAAVQEQKMEEEVHHRILQANEEENTKVAIRRSERLAKHTEERKLKIREELEEFEESERERLALVDRIVEKHTGEMESRVKEEDLEEAIEMALANPIDFEYAIDKDGHIFRGRTTKCMQVDSKDYEKIPLAISEDQFEIAN